MKKTIFFLLFTSIAFAQIPHFTATNRKVSWELAFKTSETAILPKIDKNDKININKDNVSGKGINLRCNCKGGTFYLENTFDINFTIEFKDGKYKIVVSDINFESEGDNDNKSPIENYVLRLGQNVFHPTDKNKLNLTCLDTYFTKIFQITNSEISEF
jgi:hypothetical protein